MTKIIASNTTGIVAETFFSWRLVLTELKKESIQAEKARLESLHSQSYTKALGCWAKSSSSTLRKSAFQAWYTVVQESRRERETKTQRSVMAMKLLHSSA